MRAQTLISGEEGQPGSKYKALFVSMGKVIEMTETVTDNVPNRKFAFNLEYKAFKKNHNEILFSENNGVTTVTETNSYIGNGIMLRSIYAIFKSQSKKDRQEMYDALKAAIEKQ